MRTRVAGESRALRLRMKANVSVQWRLEWHAGEPVAVPEGVEQRARDEGVAEAAERSRDDATRPARSDH